MAAKGFGSFFNKPVEDLLAFKGTEQEYINYGGIDKVVSAADDVFSKSCSVKPSDMHPGLKNSGFTFVNQGAFGGAYLPLMKVAQYWREVQQQQPLVFFDRILLPACAMSIRCLAEEFSVTPQEVFLFPSATYALNTVLNNVSQPGACTDIVTFSTTYGSVKKMATQYFPTTSTQVQIPLSQIMKWNSEEDVLSWFRIICKQTISQMKKPVIMLESISSNTAIKWPYQKMAIIAKEINSSCYVLVDAAHQLGMFSIPKIKCIDAFIVNGHKWLATPSGVGALILPEYGCEGKKIVTKPLVVSHGSESSFSSATLWHGHTDYTPWLTIPWALRLRDKNLNFILKNIYSLADSAESILMKSWNVTKVFDRSITAPLLRLVRLPPQIQKQFSNRGSDLQNILHSHQIECPVKDLESVLYVRISTFTYNSIAHYEKLARIVNDIAEGRESKL